MAAPEGTICHRCEPDQLTSPHFGSFLLNVIKYGSIRVIAGQYAPLTSQASQQTAAKQLSSIAYPNSQTTNFSWYTSASPSQFEKLEQITNLDSNSNNLTQYGYQYSAVGDIAQWTQKVTSGATTAQDDFGQIPVVEKPTNIPTAKEAAKGPSSQQQDQALTDSLSHIRKRLGSEATEVNWIEKQKPPSLKAQFTKNKYWLQLRFAEKTHESAELHPTMESVYIYKPDGPHIFVSFGIKGGGADIVWAFQYLKYNDRPAFRPAWEHNPFVEPLSAAEVGKMCAEQLANLSEQR